MRIVAACVHLLASLLGTYMTAYAGVTIMVLVTKAAVANAVSFIWEVLAKNIINNYKFWSH